VKRVVLACLLASACKREPEQPKPRESTPHTLSGTPGIELDKPFSLAAGARATVSIDEGVRIELRGPGRYLLTGEQLLASDGLLSVDVAAQAVRAGQHAFKVATPAGLLEVPFAARLVLHAPARGASELALITGEVLADGALPVGANTRVCFAAVGPHLLTAPGFTTVEAALQALATSQACAEDRAPELAKLDNELAQQLELFTRSKAEQEALIASAREHAPPNLVQDLAARGQLTLAARTRVLALRAQLSAAQLGAAEDPVRAALLTRANELENPTR
jgi:hypothetical protein